jgi:hypothetical protein
MKRRIPRKANPAIATFTQIDISIDNMFPPWRGKSWGIPLATRLNDCPVFRYTPFYFKNKFNVKRKNIDHRVKLEKLRYGVIREKLGPSIEKKDEETRR